MSNPMTSVQFLRQASTSYSLFRAARCPWPTYCHRAYSASSTKRYSNLNLSRTSPRQVIANPAANPIQPPPQSTTLSQATELSDSSTGSQSLTEGFNDYPVTLDESGRQVDWARSFHGLSTEPFSKEAADILLSPISPMDVEVKPDGIVYLPEIKYRRILNKAFGPGGWGLAPRGESIVTEKAVTREYALVAHGRYDDVVGSRLFLFWLLPWTSRLVSIARGSQDYFSPDNIPTATEGCKSNAMMRCCKDLGVASELWDPRFIRDFLSKNAREVFVEHALNKKRRKIWIRKDDQVRYPFKELKGFTPTAAGV